MSKHFPLEVIHKCSETNCDFKCVSEEDFKLHITSSHNSNLCTFCGKTSSSERFLRQHIDDKHIAETDTDLKRELSMSSKCAPPAKHVRSIQEVNEKELILLAQNNSLNEHIKLLNNNYETLMLERNEKDQQMEHFKGMLAESQIIIEELLTKNTDIENERLQMLDVNTKLENEMIERNSKLELEVRDLKRQIEPDDEVEQLAILMAGKKQKLC